MARFTPFAAGERLTAAKVAQMVGEWNAYTPSWTADSGTTTLGNGTLTGKYQRIGNTVNFRIFFEWGSTSAQSVVGGGWRFSLPTSPWSGDGGLFWTATGWVSNPSDNTSRWLVSGFIDTSLGAITIATPSGSTDQLRGNTVPNRTAATTTTIQPGGSAASAGVRLNLFGTYETAN